MVRGGAVPSPSGGKTEQTVGGADDGGNGPAGRQRTRRGPAAAVRARAWPTWKDGRHSQSKPTRVCPLERRRTIAASMSRTVYATRTVWGWRRVSGGEALRGGGPKCQMVRSTALAAVEAEGCARWRLL